METRNYELMFIASPELDEEGLEILTQRVQRYLETAEAQVFSFKSWGLRRMAYTIKGQREGRYYLVQFAAPTLGVNELDRNIRLMEDIVRHIIIRVDDMVIPETPEEPAKETTEAVSLPEAVEETPEAVSLPEAVEETPEADSLPEAVTETPEAASLSEVVEESPEVSEADTEE